MNRKIISVVVFCIFIGIFIGHYKALAQEFKTVKFNYISPVPGSKYIMPDNNIAFRHGDPIQVESLQNFSIEVNGSKSGIIAGLLNLSSDSRTVIFKPDNPFVLGEEVQVCIFDGLETKSGFDLEQEFFSFTVTPAIPELEKDYFLKKEITYYDNPAIIKSKEITAQTETRENNLPSDFPEITVNASENIPPEGYYFVAPFGNWGWYPQAVPYLIIFDKFGIPVFYRENSHHAYDFKKLYNGNMAYYSNSSGWYRWVVEDDTYNIVDDWVMQNGYWTDWHEFQLLSESGHEGNAIVMAHDPQFFDMSQVVPGGDPQAIVVGWVIQEQDINKNVIFQWRSWDHYLITDAHEHVDLTESTIDPFHGNAIEVYSNSEILLSARNLNEITKINWNTGNIIWRLGGKNNMFEFVNDTLGFSMQHDCRRLENGNLSLFDNGTYHPENFSSFIEYALDEVNYKATLINRFQHSPDAYGKIMGNAQESYVGNTIVGWGSSGEPAITEFDSNGEILAEINIESINYRAYRFPWKTSAFSLGADSLHFGYIYYEDEVVKSLKIQNNMDHEIEITSYFSMNEAFSVQANFPITIQSEQSISIPVVFSPGLGGYFQGVITINSDINTSQISQRIAQQIFVEGEASENQSTEDINTINVSLYPNPVLDFLTIEFIEGHSNFNIKVIDSQSKVVYSNFNEKNFTHVIDFRNIARGIYNLQLEDEKLNKIASYKIIKQ